MLTGKCKPMLHYSTITLTFGMLERQLVLLEAAHGCFDEQNTKFEMLLHQP
jgi:hypothetical protein